MQSWPMDLHNLREWEPVGVPWYPYGLPWTLSGLKGNGDGPLKGCPPPLGGEGLVYRKERPGGHRLTLLVYN